MGLGFGVLKEKSWHKITKKDPTMRHPIPRDG
jgi:hypothetical protein